MKKLNLIAALAIATVMALCVLVCLPVLVPALHVGVVWVLAAAMWSGQVVVWTENLEVFPDGE